MKTQLEVDKTNRTGPFSEYLSPASHTKHELGVASSTNYLAELLDSLLSFLIF